MLDLARDPCEKVRLVTTNFDRLFEACDNTLKSWHPPRLPDPQRYEEFEGVIHLHGRGNVNSVLRSNPDCAKSIGYRRNPEPDWAAEALNLPGL
jgi:hypothetical protein